jgi:N-acetylmuramoyl-L-alanine amidase
MRPIRYIVLHCTATPQSTTIESISSYWKNKLGWKSPGYHFIIKPSGEVVNLHPIEKPSNGVAGYNATSIHISYIGGVDRFGKPVDNRTPEQVAAQIDLLKRLTREFPKAKILGHRDFPGVKKACPSFDVAGWLDSINDITKLK